MSGPSASFVRRLTNPKNVVAILIQNEHRIRTTERASLAQFDRKGLA